jgi:ribose-phosphate pyrophosphokinase
MNEYVDFDRALCSVWRYPGGEVGVRAVGAAPRKLLARIHSSDELLALIHYLDAVQGQVEELLIPYLPYARQDRVAAPGDPLAIAVLARLLCSSGVRTFASLDVHSPAAERAFSTVGASLRNLPATPWLQRFVEHCERSPDQELWFVAPDKGARTRTRALAEALSSAQRPIGLIHGEKVRDPHTGALAGFRIDPQESPPTLERDALVVVVDDICDGGGTFLGLAAALRKSYGEHELNLWTTHGIYSKGLDELAAHYQRIGCTDSFRSGRSHARLSVLALNLVSA